MGIDEFRKKFVDEIDESNECGVPATIELGTIYESFTVWGYIVSGSKLTFLTTDDYDHRPSRPYEFTDKSIFDGIETVTFLVNGKELYDFTLEDVSWSERIFSFEGDFQYVQDKRTVIRRIKRTNRRKQKTI